MTDKPAWGYQPKPFATYTPAPEEMHALVGKIEKLIGKPTSLIFRDRLQQLVILLRAKVEIDRNAPNHTAFKAELEQVTNALKKLDDLFTHKRLSNHLYTAFRNKTPKYYEHLREADPISATAYYTDILLQMSADIQDDLKQKPEAGIEKVTLVDVRNRATEELARLLDKEGHKPTITRGGTFEHCLIALFQATRCTINGHEIYIDRLESLYPVIREAIHAYPDKPMWELLR